MSRDDIDGTLYVRTDADAARHLFRVAAGLDSLVVGEPEILGQVKDAYKAASESRGTGSVINRLFHGAFAIGKRVRTDTGLSEGAVSLATRRSRWPARSSATCATHHFVVFGAGEMARLSALHFHEHVASTTIATRRQDRGEALAGEVHGQRGRRGTSASKRWQAPTSSSRPRDRRIWWSPRPTCDACSPPGEDARCSSSIWRCLATSPRRWRRIEEVFLYNIDDLRGIVQENLARRQDAVAKAERLVNDEVAAWYGWLRSRAAIPTVVALRTRFERVRQAELERLAPRLAASDLKRARASTRSPA